MKKAVLRESQQAQDRCPQCGLTGRAAVRAEQTVARLVSPKIWRHSICDHVICYRDQALLSVDDQARIAQRPRGPLGFTPKDWKYARRKQRSESKSNG